MKELNKYYLSQSKFSIGIKNWERTIPNLMLFAISILTNACHNQKEGDAHDHKTNRTEATLNNDTIKTSANEAHHEELSPTIASLSEEQINTLDLQYGSLEQKQLTAIIKANGSLNVPNGNKANATSLFGGVVRTLNVQVGSNIKKGQIIAAVSNTDLIKMQEEYLLLKMHGNNTNDISTSSHPQYASLRLEKESLQPQIDYAKKELARQKELFEGNAGARKNLELAQSNLLALQNKSEIINSQLSVFAKTANIGNNSRINSLVQQFKMMGINPSTISNNHITTNFYITSPISGTISNVFAKIGSYIDVSSPVAEIVDNGSLHLDLNVFEKDLPKLKVGQTIHFTLTNNPMQEYDAKVYSIGSSFENETKTIPIHCTVQGNKTGLIDGMNVTAIVSLNDVTASSVPTDAIIESDGKDYIFIVTNKKVKEHHEDDEGNQDVEKDGEKDKSTLKEELINGSVNFEKVEIIKGVSNLGYTAITSIMPIPIDAKVVFKGAYFINAKLTNTEGH
jgi:membrane fusion protein, heavy metal efflux system